MKSSVEIARLGEFFTVHKKFFFVPIGCLSDILELLFPSPGDRILRPPHPLFSKSTGSRQPLCEQVSWLSIPQQCRHQHRYRGKP